MSGRPRLAVVTTHPIQYHAPLFRRLADRADLELHVFYGWKGATDVAFDHGFGREIQWDVPLLDGYPFTFVPNESRDPGTHHHNGIAGRSLVPSVERWKPDAVLVLGWAYRSHLAAMRAFHRRVPVLFRGDSTLLDETRGPKQWLRRAFLRWVYSHVDAALYVGTHNRRYFEAHGLRSTQLEWAPHAADNDRFRDPSGALAREATAWRDELRIPPGALVTLFAGKLESKKAPDLLLRAFVARGRADEHLVVAGSGPLEGELRAAVANRPNVHFLGFQNQSRMPVVYRLGDVFVLPSRGPGETWGLAVNEAMASGRPAIVSDRVGCAPDLVRPGETGAVFPSGDVVALKESLDAVLGDAAARVRLARRSEAMIRDWSADAAAACIERAVVRVAQRERQ